MTERVHGIDVSYVQRGAVDGKVVAAAGFRWAYVKATEGNTGRDSHFRALCKELLDAGLLVGAYHFARPSADDQDAARELESLYATTLDLGLQLRPCLDLESTKLTGPKTLAWAETWAWLAHNYFGNWPVIYTGSYFWEGLGGAARAAEWATNCPIWIAQYPIDPVRSPTAARVYEPPSGAGPRVPKPWSDWDAWQYSGTGGKRVPGVSVDCDRNVFNGDEARLLERFGL